MRKLSVLAILFSAHLQSSPSDYWEQVLNTSIDRQAQAHLANFQSFPVDVEPSSLFGMRIHPLTQENTLHNGIDLPGLEGEPFKAVAHGTVIFAGPLGSLGMLIAIDHGNGVITRYGHAHSLKFSKGDKVRRGDTIGLIGATGSVTGPHVHYEVIEDGRNVDPATFVAQKRGVTVEEFREQLMASQVDVDAYVDSLLEQKIGSSNENLEILSKHAKAEEIAVFASELTHRVDQGINSEIASSHIFENSHLAPISFDEHDVAKQQAHLSDEFFDQQMIKNQKNYQTLASQAKSPEDLVAYTETSEPQPENVQNVETDQGDEPAIIFQPKTKTSTFEVGKPFVTKRTLWAVADETKPAGTSVYQAMAAIFQANPAAFPGGNMNLRLLDVALMLPDEDTVYAVNHQEARDKYYDDLNLLKQHGLLETSSVNDGASQGAGYTLSSTEPKKPSASL